MIVIPMAGLSKRFVDAGYDRPKYMLPLAGKTVFDFAIESFRLYFDDTSFLFIGRDVAGTAAFIKYACESLGLRKPLIVMLDAPTAGQAETVELGLQQVGVDVETPVTIFNIDTFRPSFSFPNEDWWPRSDGYLEVFRGTGLNWSYVRPSPMESGLVLETTEKRPISDLCCTGLYHFRSAREFHAALTQERASPTSAELYVAPLYNHLIRSGMRIHYKILDREEVVFCGVPAEYESLKAKIGNPGGCAND